MSKYYKAEDVIRAIDDAFDSIPIEKTVEILKVRKTIRSLPTIEVSEDAISKHDLWRIVEDNAYWVTYNETSKKKGMTLTGINQALNECPPVAPKSKEVIYGNEHNCIMTLFGECSYSETGCGDCAVVEKVRDALAKTQIETQNSNGNLNDDAISREYLVKELKSTKEFYLSAWEGFSNMDDKDKARCDELDNCIATVINAPSIIPKAKEGEWIEDEYGIPRCSECNCINNTVYRNYCPNCGAKMKGKEKIKE